MIETIGRYSLGDQSLIPEIEANAASDAPINRLARESSLDSQENDMQGLEVFKRKRELEFEFVARKQKLELESAEQKQRLDLEAAERKQKMEMEKQKLDLEAAEHRQKMEMEKQKLDLETAERKQKLELETLERKQQLAERQKTFILDATEREMGTQTKILQTYTSLCPGGQAADDKGCEVFKGNFLRISTQTAPVVEVKAEDEGPDDGSTIGEMLTAMGHTFDATDTRMIGIRVFAEYKRMWGVTPVQRQVETKEGKRLASIYSHADCTLIDKVVAEYVAEKA